MPRSTVRCPLAKRIGGTPRDLAQAVVDSGALDGVASDLEVAGPGFVNVTFSAEFLAAQLAAVAGDDRLGVRPAAAGQDRRRRLLGAERRQGDARRPPAHHRHRRLARADAGVPRPPRDPGEPHRRLGHPVRHAHRAPGRPRRGAGRRTPVARRPRRLLQGGPGEVRRDPTSSRTGPASGSCCCRAATPRRNASGRCSSALSTKHFNTVYEMLGVLLTDDDLAGESTYQPLMPAGDRTARGGRSADRVRRRRRRVPAGVHQPRRRPAAADRAEGRRRLQLRHERPRLRDRPGRAARRRPARSTSSVHRSSSTSRWCSPSPRWPAGWRPPREAVHVAFGNVLGTDRKMLKSRSGEPMKFARPARRGDRARRRPPIAEKNPDLTADERADGGAHDRHRRGEVRRAVDRPRQGLRVRLGPDAVVRRQHRAVPAVRARPHLLDLPARRRRPGVGARSSTILVDTPQERALALRLLAYPTAHRHHARDATARTSCAPTCTTSRPTSRRSTSTVPVLKADEPLRSSRLALADLTARILQHALGLLGIDAPEQM